MPVRKSRLTIYLALILSLNAARSELLGQQAAPNSATAAGPIVLTDRYDDPLPPRAVARLGTVRFRQGGGVNALVFSPDGKFIATAGGFSDNAVHLWETATGKEVRRLAGPEAFGSVAIAPDGKILAAGSENDSNLRLWDVKTGRQLRVIRLTPYSLAFAPDGKFLACAYQDQAEVCIYLFDKAKDFAVASSVLQTGHVLPVRSVAFSPDGKILASASLDRSIRLWDIKTREKRIQLNVHNGGVLCVCFSPDGKRLASASQDNTIRLWDVETGKELLQLQGHTAAVRAVAFSPDGKTLASGGVDRSLRLWDAASGKPKGQPRPHRAYINSIAFSPDGKLITTGSDHKDNAIRLWDVATGNERKFGEGHFGWVGVLQLAADGRTVLSAGSDEEVYQWDPLTGQPLAHFHAGQWRKSIAFSPDNKLIAVGSDGDWISLWEGMQGRQLGHWWAHERRVTAVAFTPDGKTLLSSGDDRTLRFWDVTNPREIRRITRFLTAPVAAFAFSADGKTVFTGGADGVIEEWELAGRKRLRTLFPRNQGLIERLVLSPDHKYLAWAGSHVHVFDLPSDKDRTFGDGLPYAFNVAFAPDCRTLATTHLDRIVRIWELASGKLRTQFKGHGGAVASALFLPGGRKLLSGGSDGTILVWDLTGRLEKDRLRPSELKAAEVEVLWNALADEDAAKAYQAIWTLAAAPRQALPLLQKHLRPAVAIEEKRLVQLLKDLDDDAFAVREKASQELASLGDTAEQGLRKAMEGNPSPEMRRRLQQLLERQERSGPDYWRQTRMLEVLEQIETPEARQLLESLAKGAPGTWLSQEAKAALERWTRTRSR